MCIRDRNTTRICVIHRNVPNILTRITGAAAAENINIENMLNKSKKDFAYTILDLTTAVSDEAIAAVDAIDDIIRIRVI